jgi:hypothetical protein
MADVVLRTLAGGGSRGSKLATVIQRLVLEAAELGELETYQYLGDRGLLTTGRKFPPRWFDRLDKAIETDAFDHLSVDRIVEIMLQGPRYSVVTGLP